MSKPTRSTPGPWTIETPMGDDNPWVVEGNKQTYEWRCLAQIPAEGGEDEVPVPEAMANARLIAAAPIPQDLYDSEINFEIEPFWDGGFYIRLGDRMNGYRAEDSRDTYVEALEQLRDWAIEHFPESEFTKRYRAMKTAGAPA